MKVEKGWFVRLRVTAFWAYIGKDAHPPNRSNRLKHSLRIRLVDISRSFRALFIHIEF